ncbi:3-hydroxyacyl-ACP dehydratase [Malaciobacter mytili]|uniref:3-hydroxyacyl-ACP dehydratase n=1 Tax=Malaciobacter mytili LMG 24559 TaxID=1032238 RepID=A0AAX2AIP7_9BACT|nr:double-cubane-cluster-containing anaerobic reductase [Malaciobacter mytili]AXH14727.1 2-hydroxyacyl-CoA dehydratase [Malaciobacter mytili LMG 24559]RXI48329.1 3-hydroxyacyl-ACP dehydratase [Malaciobacter mytili]RXK16899.1 3-hydroxyacyl-ACP dehydratase [Malaciobacter mytili LMG 24559]
MGVHEHRSLLKDIGVDVERHAKMMEMGLESYKNQFMTQKNRPEAMKYFDWFMSEIQGQRIAEINELRKKKRPSIGAFCIFVPEEIIVGAGGACFGLCGGSPATIADAETELPRNICPLIKSAHGFKLQKTCAYTQSSDFIYGETTCEAKKKTWEILNKHHPVKVMNIPHMKREKDLKLWKEELVEFKEHIESITGEKLSLEEMKKGTKIVNEKREALQRLDRLRSMNKDIIPISGKDGLFVTQMGFLDDPVRYTQKVNELCDELEKRVENKISVFEEDTPRLIVLGTPFAPPNWKLHTAVETSGGAIINEESCIGHRYYKDNVNLDEVTTEDELMQKLLDKYSAVDCACFTPNAPRIDKILKMYKDRQADGVIYYTLSFCHTYNVEAHLVTQALEKEGIACLVIESDYSPEDAGQIKTRVEAFLESINFKKKATSFKKKQN